MKSIDNDKESIEIYENSMRNTSYIRAVSLLILACGLFMAPPGQGMDFYQIREAGPPEITDEGILFTYKPEKRTPTYVMVSGSFDNWESLHMMTRTPASTLMAIPDYTFAGAVTRKAIYFISMQRCMALIPSRIFQKS